MTVPVFRDFRASLLAWIGNFRYSVGLICYDLLRFVKHSGVNGVTMSGPTESKLLNSFFLNPFF